MKKLFFCLLISTGLMAQSNAIRFSPIGVNEIGATVGLTYERFLSQKLSLVFPLDVVFRQHDNYWNGDQLSSPAYFYFTPGFKFYPASVDRPVKYAIGANAVIGAGQRYYSVDNHYNSPYLKANNTRLGIMVTNYVNFDITSRFTMGINFGLGLLYVDQSKYKNNDLNGTVQLGTNFGFKF
ncbi:hypothetical protein Lbys_1500 [Leadbetterella byssophila DSM 17132]|jgi:hypothetical protein|uniref:Outer membrane protein beta-barrel domain-containing protein n=1 Tax=Leadbetterella byssophila (strain DSM 17132 / JCM 16389 / KACC 11308 / NBRC 106382 / 4M15) TaxID=649349 RepID=E4RXH8_LEAB4|nr:hypothetical protein [Leadbetterella byssophila]ADQ17213.1 hypothetical protein Lbys_1500 [Leadbetterella byssophila DSM 17132]